MEKHNEMCAMAEYYPLKRVGPYTRKDDEGRKREEKKEEYCVKKRNKRKRKKWGTDKRQRKNVR